MKELNDKHWTDDAERIERYVLNRLNADERNELEDHLRVCEVCKRAVRAEQVLVAGMRRSGRDAFKAELQSTIASIPEKKTPWAQILSAAAVVGILLTVGVYNRWFVTQTAGPNQPAVLTQQEPQGEAKDKGSERVIAEGRASTPETPTASSTERMKSLSDDSKKAKGAKEIVSSHLPIAGQVARETATGDHTQESQVSRDIATEPSAGMAKEELASQNEIESVSAWVEGTVLPFLDVSVHGNIATEKRDLNAPAYRLRKSAEAKGTTRDESGTRQTYALGNIVLRQQALTPRQQSQRTQQNLGSTIPAQLVRQRERIELTLFLDTLINEEEFATTTVEELPNDTLIVHLQNRRIAYEIPSGWNTNRVAKPAK